MLKMSNNDKNMRGQIKNLTASITNKNALHQQIQAKSTADLQLLRSSITNTHATETKLINAQLELENIKCCTTIDSFSRSLSVPHAITVLPPQPFVVVLVDGDAYQVRMTGSGNVQWADSYQQWAPDIALDDKIIGSGNPQTWEESLDPGGSAAMRIRNEVMKYILNHTDQVPATSKIITRVFINFARSSRVTSSRSDGNTSSKPVTLNDRRNKSQPGVGLVDFALQFTEKMPLFDMFDAGRGKERVDDKIRGR
jgi:hypothetical protein